MTEIFEKYKMFIDKKISSKKTRNEFLKEVLLSNFEPDVFP